MSRRCAPRRARGRPRTLELRAWALAQTAEHQNAPLWERLRELGIVSADPDAAAYALSRRTRTTGAKPGSGTLVNGLAPSANP